MLPKPAHLGDVYATQWLDRSMIAAYPYRQPYPPAVFSILAGLIVGPSRTVLDIGCGTGDIARGLVPLVDRVDAVDISTGMIDLGRTLPGGNDPRLRWIVGRAEEVALDPPYGLVTAGESLHWMRWDMLLPRLAELLAPGGVLAIIGRGAADRPPWYGALTELLGRFSTNRDFRSYDLVDELVQRRLFTPRGEARTELVTARQPIAGFVESFHSRNGFSRDRMTPKQADAFDRKLAALVAPITEDGTIELQTIALVHWGVPHGPDAPAST